MSKVISMKELIKREMAEKNAGCSFPNCICGTFPHEIKDNEIVCQAKEWKDRYGIVVPK